MRWSIVRLIWSRELRDQLRDRRTILMIAVLPLVLYPILGGAILQFALGSGDEKPRVVGVVGAEWLPAPPSRDEQVRTASLVSVVGFPSPGLGGPGLRLDTLVALQAVRAYNHRHPPPYPPLLVHEQFSDLYFDSPQEADSLLVKELDAADPEELRGRQVDVILTVRPGFLEQLEAGGQPVLRLDHREDERSRAAVRRVKNVLARWKLHLRQVQLQRAGLPADFDEVFEVREPERRKSPDRIAAESVADLLVRFFPFLLVMWSLAGALYPAVDLCAGEKERGTMETLLISPASRVEIVVGKFLTIWVFSFASALLNLASMGLTATRLSGQLVPGGLSAPAMLWCVVLSLPLTAFFSAICLAIGAYARSTKEGQYYLMPLFLVTMPLIFLTMAPGVELNPFYSLVPVTGVALLMQRLMTSPLEQVPWIYFGPVLLPIVLYSWLALRWAIEQFNREEVLFREAERLDLVLWLRRLFRDKDPYPSVGQALFCFGVILTLRWLAFGLGEQWPLPVRTAIGYLAFVAAPPLFMALLLTARPKEGLLLRLPTLRAAAAGPLLAVLLLPPLSGLTMVILEQFPPLRQLVAERNPLTEELWEVSQGELGEARIWQYGLVLGLLPAVCEELAFRGFILSGLRRRYHARAAILFSSFLFALFHMNVFQFLPAFLLGAVLGLLAVRSGSLLPGILFHLVHNGLMIGLVRLGAWLREEGYSIELSPAVWIGWLGTGLVCAALAASLLWRLSRLPQKAEA
jgi:sodium transport system permease protein